MVNTKILNFGSKELRLLSLEPLSSNIEKNSRFIFDKFLNELNHNFKVSSANKFNNSQTNIPIFLKSEFIDFLEYNIDFAKHFQEFFNPFKFSDNDTNLSTSQPSYVKDKKKESIVKLKNFTFDTSYLRSSYVLEIFMRFLKENGVINYSILLLQIIVTSGDHPWNSRFQDSELFFDKTFELKNSAAILVQSGIENSKFPEFIMIGKNLSYLKILEGKLKMLDSIEQLQEAATNYKIDIAILNNNKVEVLKGI